MQHESQGLKELYIKEQKRKEKLIDWKIIKQLTVTE